MYVRSADVGRVYVGRVYVERVYVGRVYVGRVYVGSVDVDVGRGTDCVPSEAIGYGVDPIAHL